MRTSSANGLFKGLFSLLMAMVMVSATALASSPTERIRDRLPAIDALKASGLVGESADGYLVVRERVSPEEGSLVEAENADRRRLYEAISERTGQSAAEVGRQRALRLFELSKPGLWLRGADGNWFQK
jgi:hypothetical protein